jgi:hypothetical protein
MAKKNESKAGLVAGIAAAAAAAAAGAYFLYGKNGAKNRRAVKGWMLKAKGEVLDQMEKGKELTEDAYHKIIDRVAQKYQAAKNIDRSELDQMAKELKGHWVSIRRQLAAKSKSPKKAS